MVLVTEVDDLRVHMSGPVQVDTSLNEECLFRMEILVNQRGTQECE